MNNNSFYSIANRLNINSLEQIAIWFINYAKESNKRLVGNSED